MLQTTASKEEKPHASDQAGTKLENKKKRKELENTGPTVVNRWACTRAQIKQLELTATSRNPAQIAVTTSRSSTWPMPDLANWSATELASLGISLKSKLIPEHCLRQARIMLWINHGALCGCLNKRIALLQSDSMCNAPKILVLDFSDRDEMGENIRISLHLLSVWFPIAPLI